LVAKIFEISGYGLARSRNGCVSIQGTWMTERAEKEASFAFVLRPYWY